jgi:hypothetical protein
MQARGEHKFALIGKCRQKTFDALEWLAAISAHLPDKSEQKGFV